MLDELQPLLEYWPSGAFVAALIAAVFAAGWFGVSLKRLRTNLSEARKRQQDLAAARAASREYLAKVKARRADTEKLNTSAAELFWRNEKTWIG